MVETLTIEQLDDLHDRIADLLILANKRATNLRDCWASTDYSYLFELQGHLLCDPVSYFGLATQLVNVINPRKVPLVSLNYLDQLPILNKIEMLRKLKSNVQV